MKIKDIKDKDDAGLQTELAEKMRHLFDLRSQAVTDKLTDPTQLGKTRKDIARIKTVQAQRKTASVAK
jgi:large subunit ribosomal protein L29